MKIVLDIPENKVSFMMELLRSLSFVKTNPLPVGISDEKLFSWPSSGNPLTN